MADLARLRAERGARGEHERQAFLDALFLNAMESRFHPGDEERGHLYLEKFDIPQIKLFDLLINGFPFVVMGHRIVNTAITDIIAGTHHCVLIDVGIGRGIQMARLVQALAEGAHPERLTIIGVEPFHDALVHAEQAVRQAGLAAGVKVDFIGLECLAEHLAFEQLHAVLPGDYDKLVVNASLTAHHIPSPAQRGAFFDMIRRLKPNALLLTEPDTNHMESDWRQRVENAYAHYGALFGVIDGLDLAEADKKGLKAFFGREIVDVVSLPDDRRVERHEPTSRWLEYLAHSGFQVCPPPQAQGMAAAAGLSYRREAGYLSLGYQGFPVLSVMQCEA